MNKTLICILFVMMLLIPMFSISADVTYSNELQREDNKTSCNKEYQEMIKSIPIKFESTNKEEENLMTTTQIKQSHPFHGPGDQITPEILQTELGIIFSVYYDCDSDRLHLCGSADQGNTWSILRISPGKGLYYPSIDNWALNRVFITSKSPSFDHEGGFVVIGELPDILNPQLINESVFDMSVLGFYDMKDASIACDNSGKWWEFGVAAYIMSYQSADETYDDIPILVYMDPEDEDSGWFHYLSVFEHCGHCDNDIDLVSHQHFVVYDQHNTSKNQWNMVIIQSDFKNPDLDLWKGYTIDNNDDIQNLQRPVVSSYDDHLIILCEYEKDGNSDIICYHTFNQENLLEHEISFIANTSDQEYCPNIFHVENTTFVASFVKNGDIYTTWTMDAGVTWTSPFRVNENQGLVTNTYESSDLWYPYLVWEEIHDDIDLFLEKISIPPDTPILDGRNKDDVGKPYDLTITSTQREGLNISYYVDWGDGTNTSWTELTPSGEPVILTHTYESNMTYQIKGKARNEYGVESRWSYLETIIPKKKGFPTLYHFILEYFPHFTTLLRMMQII